MYWSNSILSSVFYRSTQSFLLKSQCIRWNFVLSTDFSPLFSQSVERYFNGWFFFKCFYVDKKFCFMKCVSEGLLEICSTTRCTSVEFECLNPSGFFPVWTVISVQWMRNDFCLFVSCVSEPCCAVDHFDFYCILLCLCGSDFFFFFFWYGKTSILESVKLLNLWPPALCGCLWLWRCFMVVF